MVSSTYAYSGLGGRKNNEDYFLYRKGIWVVADGLGGHDCGEVASKTASETVVDFVKENGICVIPKLWRNGALALPPRHGERAICKRDLTRVPLL